MKTPDPSIILPPEFGPAGKGQLTRAQRQAIDDFRDAENEAFRQLPVMLRKAFEATGVPCCYQIILKGLKAGEFTEDQVAAMITERAAQQAQLARLVLKPGMIQRPN